jgi:hypothetical protein
MTTHLELCFLIFSPLALSEPPYALPQAVPVGLDLLAGERH